MCKLLSPGPNMQSAQKCFNYYLYIIIITSLNILVYFLPSAHTALHSQMIMYVQITIQFFSLCITPLIFPHITIF